MTIDRRGFCINCCVAVLGAFVSEIHSSDRRFERRCYVAGVRFYDTPVSLRTGDSVIVVAEDYENSQAMSVQTVNSLRLGYIPKKMLPMLNESTILGASVIRYDRHAVPWRRIEISLILDK
jgi:hypothetical protein